MDWTVLKGFQTHLNFLFYSLMWSLVPGELGPQRLACDLSLCGRPGCDEGGCHQRRAGHHGARGQSLPETRAGEPDGRLEVLHLLWFSGLPTVGWDTGGDVLAIHCPVYEPLRWDDSYLNVYNIRHSCWISSNIDFYQVDHLAILNVTSIITALLWLTLPGHWQVCPLCLLAPTVESLWFFLLCMITEEKLLWQ